MVELEHEIKLLLIDCLGLEDIGVEDISSEAPLFGEGLGLDSIDALELGLALKNRYDVRLDENTEFAREHFYSIASLARFVQAQKSSGQERMP
jgi:acyl carrier protein